MKEKGGILRVRRFYFPGDTFHILEEKEEKQHGEYRPRCLVFKGMGCHGVKKRKASEKDAIFNSL
ncbi:MAG: hypothetical protein Q7V12_01765 [Deltaproteobacteria bacterium]|nr:hypothetical protein [Deltaproteobacteria bacterium]MDP2971212.1 hypothetical protein [Deltaproteobacteria bacterium]